MRGVLNVIMNNTELNESRRLIQVTLRVGEMRDMVDHLVQMYWNYITKNTPAEGSTIKLITVPTTCSCNQCNNIYPVKIMEIDQLECPKCGHNKAKLLTGDELFVEEVEIKTVNIES